MNLEWNFQIYDPKWIFSCPGLIIAVISSQRWKVDRVACYLVLAGGGMGRKIKMMWGVLFSGTQTCSYGTLLHVDMSSRHTHGDYVSYKGVTACIIRVYYEYEWWGCICQVCAWMFECAHDFVYVRDHIYIGIWGYTWIVSPCTHTHSHFWQCKWVCVYSETYTIMMLIL